MSGPKDPVKNKEWREKIAAKSREITAARWQDPVYRAKALATLEANRRDPQVEARRLAGIEAARQTQEYHENLSNGLKRRYEDPAEHDKSSVAAKRIGAGTWNKGKIFVRTSETRDSMTNKEWCAAVKQRDGNKCTRCGSTARIAAHHIIGWNEDPSLRFVVENGITLCNSCHGKHHFPKGTKFGARNA